MSDASYKAMMDEAYQRKQQEDFLKLQSSHLCDLRPGVCFRITDDGLRWMRLSINADTLIQQVHGIPVTCVDNCNTTGMVQMMPTDLVVLVD